MQQPQANNNRFSGRNTNKQLVDWVNSKLENYPEAKVKDLTKSWQNGHSFCALIHVLGCDIDYPGMKFETTEEQIANMNRAFTAALEKMRIPKLLDAEDIVEVQDQKSITTYLFEIQKKFSRPTSQLVLPSRKEMAESLLIPKTEPVVEKGVEQGKEMEKDKQLVVTNDQPLESEVLPTKPVESLSSPPEVVTHNNSELSPIELSESRTEKSEPRTEKSDPQAVSVVEETEEALVGDFSPATKMPDSKVIESRVTFKIVVIGNSSVGKTCILERFATDQFQRHSVSTIGIDSRTQSYRIGGDSSSLNSNSTSKSNNASEVVTFNLFDTAGQEKYRSLTRHFFRGAHGVVLVYDVTNSDSFASVESWINDIGAQTGEADGGVAPHVILVGNKTDLANERAVSSATGRACAEANGFCFMETSAQSGRNVARAFQILMQDVYRSHCARSRIQSAQSQVQEVASNRITLRKERGPENAVSGDEALKKEEDNSCYC